MSYSSHTDITKNDILELLASTSDPATVKQVANVLTTGNPVTSSDPAYEYVRVKMKAMNEEGLVYGEKEGRSWTYTITEAGRDRIDGPVGDDATLPALVGHTDPDPTAPPVVGVVEGADDDNFIVRWEREDGTVEETNPIARGAVEPVEDRAEWFDTYPTDDAADDDAGDEDNDLDAIIDEAEGDGVDLDVPEPPTPTESNGRGQRRVDEDKADETMTAPTHFPDNGETREVTRWLTGGEKCEGAGIIITDDAARDFDVDEMPQSAAFRLRCPHCGATKHANVNKDGTAKVCSHPRATGTPHPRSPLWIYNEDEGEWALVDPTTDEAPVPA